MKKLVTLLISGTMVFFFSQAHAGQTEKEKTMHEMHAMMRLMDNALCQALEGANLVMFGQMGESGKTDKDLIERGTAMVKDGKAVILKTLAGSNIIKKADIMRR